MKPAPVPADETARLKALREYDILDTLPEQAYDDITFLASHICETPIAAVSLIDRDRQWLKSKIGIDVSETSREEAFCAHSILQPRELTIVPDATQDPRFADHPLVTGEPNIRFYAAAPLTTSNGHALGTLCVVDLERRELTAAQKSALRALSRQVMGQLDLRRTVSRFEDYHEKLERYHTKLEESVAELRAENRIDALTGLANRAALDNRLEEEFHRSQRYKTPLSLLLLDVDHFKAFNDEFGHPAGDSVLRKIAEILQKRGRRCDLVARYGGEEFAIVAANTEIEGGAILAERVRKLAESTDMPHRPVTLSVGVAEWNPAMSGVRDLVEHADRALYEAKTRGRNRVSEAPPFSSDLRVAES